MVTGSAPGLGKTSLAHWLVSHLENESRNVGLFEEADILDRSEFADLISIWCRNEVPNLDVVLDAASAYLDTCRASTAQVLVQDALFPFLASLLAWGYPDDRIMEFCGELAERASDFELVQVHLSDDPSVSIPRAAAREGPGWLETMVARASAWPAGASVKDLNSLAAYFRANDQRAHRILRSAPWRVLFVGADRPECGVRDEVAHLLGSADVLRRLFDPTI